MNDSMKNANNDNDNCVKIAIAVIITIILVVSGLLLMVYAYFNKTLNMINRSDLFVSGLLIGVVLPILPAIWIIRNT